ncbi:MAG: thiamine diphosphokinase [Clostridium sp.]
MKSCLIMTGGYIDLNFAKEFLSKRTYDMIIAVDSGLEHLRNLQIVPNQIVGDLDSVNPEILKEYRNNPDIHMEIHKPEKDETDTELAFLTAEKYGCDVVDLLGALGGRMDHEISNLQIMYQFYKRGMHIFIYDERNKIYLLGDRKSFFRAELYGKYISFMPLTEVVEEVTLTGFKYPLNKRKILLGSSLCISNELICNSAEMNLKKGVLICIESHD